MFECHVSRQPPQCDSNNLSMLLRKMNSFDLKSTYYEFDLENEVRKLRDVIYAKDNIIEDLMIKIDLQEEKIMSLTKSIESSQLQNESSSTCIMKKSLKKDVSPVPIQDSEIVKIPMVNKESDHPIGDFEKDEILDLFHETIRRQENFEELVGIIQLNKMKKRMTQYEKQVSDLEHENFDLIQKMRKLEIYPDRKPSINTPIPSTTSSPASTFPSSISLNSTKSETIEQTMQKESKLLRKEKDFYFQDLSFDIVKQDQLGEPPVRVLKVSDTENDEHHRAIKRVEKTKDDFHITQDNNSDLLKYSPIKDYYNNCLQKELCLSEFKIQNLKIVIDAIISNEPISKWSKTLLICWMKNFLMIPPEVIPDLLAIIQSFDYENFNVKLEMKKRKKLNQFYVLKALLAIHEILEDQKLNLAHIDRINYFNRCMHHQWMANFFLTHIGLVHFYTIFQQKLVDSRVLCAMNEKNIKHYFKISSIFKRKSLVFSAQYLKTVQFDRKKFEMLIHREQELVDELKFWSNQRFTRWLANFINVDIVIGALQTSGICGFMIHHVPDDTLTELKFIIKKHFTNEIVEKIVIEYNNLLKSRFIDKNQELQSCEKLSKSKPKACLKPRQAS